ncbi:hypothetical protein BY996DRAFT_7394699 [Phakopsora pachyrhizi]|nr:hypothetical protein BY996DRAFT_7394699 [Phakopsora pachyrhizi]
MGFLTIYFYGSSSTSFLDLDRVGSENMWDSMLHEYISLEFKDINNSDLNHPLEETLAFLKSSEIIENEQTQIRDNLLHNLLNVESLPTLMELHNAPEKMRVYFSLFWLLNYLIEEKKMGSENFSQSQSYVLYKFLKGFIHVYSNNGISPSETDLDAKYFLLDHTTRSYRTIRKASIYKLQRDYITALKPSRLSNH